jgi:hypothetical protein
MRDGMIPGWPAAYLCVYRSITDNSRLLRGANTSSNSNPNPENKRRSLICLAGLIEYPGFGCILFETGCAEDLQVVGDAAASMHPSD